jgi:phage terminase Nu1 subunit (DNA packaging protein)
VNAERYVDARELAETLGVSRRTVAYWVAAGCPSETWGMRVRRFRLSEVVAWRRAADTVPEHSPRPEALQRRRD